MSDPSVTELVSKTSNAEFRPDIEGLRGLAILAVVGFHAGVPGLVGGYVGVDVFYVLSGYLISRLILIDLARSNTVSFTNFYARRARRLAPAAALVLVATLVLSAVVNAPLELPNIARSGQSAAVYLSNFRFARASIDYFGANASVDPFLHTWSLAVEEQFYLVWPLLLLVIHSLATRLVPSRVRMATGIAMAVVTIASLALCIVLTRRVQPWAFYASPPRFWEFGIGALATLVPARVGRSLTSTRAIPFVFLAAVLVPCVTFRSLALFPGWIATIPVLGTAGLLRVGATAPRHLLAQLLGHRSMQWIGRHSYSWYLWHWPLIIAARIVWPNASIVISLAASGASLLLAVATFRLLEHPVRASTWLRRRAVVSIAMAFVLAGIGLLSVQALRRYTKHVMARPAQQRYADAKVDNPRVYGDKCTVPFLALRPEHDCVYGDPSSAKNVVLVGDSHAAQWFVPIEKIATAHGWRLTVRIKDSCPPIPLEIYSDRLHRIYGECARWRDEVLREIVDQHPALVIMSSSDAYVRETDETRLTIDDYRLGLHALRSRLDAAHVPFVWIADTPSTGVNVPVCLSRRDAAMFGRSDCTFQRATAWKPAVRDAQQEILGSDRVIDLSASFCAPTALRCDVERDGMVLYRDNNHLTATFAATFGPALEAGLSTPAPTNQ